MAESVSEASLSTEQLVNDVLATIEREREREIISRRFGLFDRKETLEQIGELLGITRERVRQMEKDILISLKIAAEEGRLELENVERYLVEQLHEMGRAARLSELTDRVIPNGSDRDR